MMAVSCTKIQGTISSRGDAVGNWTFTPDGCISGDRIRTVGATLYTDKNQKLGVRIAKDFNNMLSIAVIIPSTCKADGTCQAVILDSKRCGKYSGDVNLTNITTSDDYRKADGFVNFDCTVLIGAKKGAIKGAVKFSNCD